MTRSDLQARQAEAFRAACAPGAFIIPNPWDAGTARLLAMAGFEALATTSAGYAFSKGQPDNAIDRDAMLDHIAEIVAAGGLPVSADLENGFGDAPDTVAETIRLAAEPARWAARSRRDGPRRCRRSMPAKRRSSVSRRPSTRRALPFPFTLTARCETSMAATTSPTRSRGSSPIAMRAPTCCTRPASPMRTTSRR